MNKFLESIKDAFNLKSLSVSKTEIEYLNEEDLLVIYKIKDRSTLLKLDDNSIQNLIEISRYNELDELEKTTKLIAALISSYNKSKNI